MPVFAVIPAAGDGEGLEQTLRHLRWLQGGKSWPPSPPWWWTRASPPRGWPWSRPCSGGDPTLLFCLTEEATYILQRKGDHGYFSL